MGPKTIDNNNSENRILNTEHSNHFVAAQINLNNDNAAALPLVHASDSYMDRTKPKVQPTTVGVSAQGLSQVSQI